jgi:predicted nucleotidyltransferase component of viral defense system
MIALHEIVRQYPKELQHPEFYDQMVKEYFHHYMLQSLFSGKFGGKINFLGGTALRYFYNLKRFSEDLDFDCFNLARSEFLEMTTKVEKDLQASGYDVNIEDKTKYDDLKAFRRVFVFPQLKYNLGISQQKEAKFFIKIEAEPHNVPYQSDIKTLIGFGITIPVKTVPLTILFSSKIAAAISRKKDRDFYDVVNLINFAAPDFGYLNDKCRIATPSQLQKALLNAAEERKLDARSIFDCEHMLFDKTDLFKIRKFSEYIEAFDFSRFE